MGFLTVVPLSRPQDGVPLGCAKQGLVVVVVERLHHILACQVVACYVPLGYARRGWVDTGVSDWLGTALKAGVYAGCGKVVWRCRQSSRCSVGVHRRGGSYGREMGATGVFCGADVHPDQRTWADSCFWGLRLW